MWPHQLVPESWNAWEKGQKWTIEGWKIISKIPVTLQDTVLEVTRKCHPKDITDDDNNNNDAKGDKQDSIEGVNRGKDGSTNNSNT